MYIDEKGNKWFKGNLHTHTNRSDGSLSPDEVLMQFKQSGYDFVALTDHRQLSTERYFDQMLVMNGCEFDNGSDDFKSGVYHIVGVGLESDPEEIRKARNPQPQEMIDAINHAGGLAILAHPAWSFNRPEEIQKLHGIAATEIYNTFSGAPWNKHPYSGEFIDMMMLDGYIMNCTAADDSHWYQGEQCRSYIWVKAEECTTEAIKSAIRAGDFYATQGPRFHHEIKDGKLIVYTTPAKSVTFFTDTGYEPDNVTYGCFVQRAEYKIKRKNFIIRYEITGINDDMGWSSPIKIEL